MGGNAINLVVPSSESPSVRDVEKPGTDGAVHLAEASPPMQPPAVGAH